MQGKHPWRAERRTLTTPSYRHWHHAHASTYNGRERSLALGPDWHTYSYSIFAQAEPSRVAPKLQKQCAKTGDFLRIPSKKRLISAIWRTGPSPDSCACRVSNFETALAEAKKALEAGGAERMNSAAESLQNASHKLAEAMYQGAASSASPGPEAGASSGPKSKEDEVIDAEYVDTEKK